MTALEIISELAAANHPFACNLAAAGERRNREGRCKERKDPAVRGGRTAPRTADMAAKVEARPYCRNIRQPVLKARGLTPIHVGSECRR